MLYVPTTLAQTHFQKTMDRQFARFEDGNPLVPVWCINKHLSGCMHRFFDSSPISPSGRFVALTRLPYENQLPVPGDACDIVVVDLVTGRENILAQSRAWDTQVGCHIQWGATDRDLIFNDLDPANWVPFGVRLNTSNGERQNLKGTVYAISPDGRFVISPCLRRIARAQYGYGAVVPPTAIPRNQHAEHDDGLTITDTKTGNARMLVSFNEIFDETSLKRGESKRHSHVYGFHVSYSPNGKRIMFVLRNKPKGAPRECSLITMDADGGNIRLAMHPNLWGRGGHHPHWHPDSEHIVMNLNADGDKTRFILFRRDGTGHRYLSERRIGSGHPSIERHNRFVISDCRATEPFGLRDRRTSPLRLIELSGNQECSLANIPTMERHEQQGLHRVDMHPAWDLKHNKVVVNGLKDGKRAVYLVDMDPLYQRLQNGADWQALFKRPKGVRKNQIAWGSRPLE